MSVRRLPALLQHGRSTYLSDDWHSELRSPMNRANSPYDGRPPSSDPASAQDRTRKHMSNRTPNSNDSSRDTAHPQDADVIDIDTVSSVAGGTKAADAQYTRLVERATQNGTPRAVLFDAESHGIVFAVKSSGEYRVTARAKPEDLIPADATDTNVDDTYGKTAVATIAVYADNVEHIGSHWISVECPHHNRTHVIIASPCTDGSADSTADTKDSGEVIR